MPVEHFPWNGTTWFLLLKGAGISGWGVYALYGVAAAAALGSTVRIAQDQGTALGNVIGLSLLATFFIAPYGRVYDFPVLLIPLLILLGGQLPEAAKASLLAAILVLPYLQWGWLLKQERAQGSPLQNVEISYLWIPALLLLCWIATAAMAGLHRRVM
jgi:hypothetical protein